MDRIKQIEDRISRGLEEVRRQKKTLDALKARQRARDQQANRRREARRKAVLGAVVLKAVRDSKTDSAFQQTVGRLLGEALHPRDRDLFEDLLPEPGDEVESR